jgi:CspA family cold shock protein
MATGYVRMWNENGYGFIISDLGGDDLFIHISNCSEDIEELKKGQRVRFDERPSRKHEGKLEAYAVALIEPTAVRQ